MKILFLDQSGKLGGAELSLLDIATAWRDRCLVGLFQDGDFHTRLVERQVPVQILTQQATLPVSKDSGFFKGLGAIRQLMPLIQTVMTLSRDYDVIYANTQKALVVGAIASMLTRRPLVYHLRDILSSEHFSAANLKVAVTLANRCAAQVIANSQATRDAFVNAGGNPAIIQVIYNGFDPTQYCANSAQNLAIRHHLGWADRFIVGHFSRLSPWKGQHILIEALSRCPESVCAVLVGAALFGENEYVTSLHQQVEHLGLSDRVQFLGFRSDITQLINACHVVAHTSTAPEPFGRVIVEGMLCGKPVLAAAAGGAIELIEPGKTGWLVPPDDSLKLAEVIQHCYQHPELALQIAGQGQAIARQRFHLDQTNQQINALLRQLFNGGAQ
jgi:glycosyltransferase involved in cell wall biosynthesis